jgi:hypothetical protein
MKYFAIIIVIFFVFTGLVYAQENQEDPLQKTSKDPLKTAAVPKTPGFWLGGNIGLGAGILADGNATDDLGDPESQAGYGFSWKIGFEGLLYLAESYALKFEISFTNNIINNWSSGFTDLGEYKFIYNLLYAQLAIMYDSGGWTPFAGIFAGISFGNTVDYYGADFSDDVKGSFTFGLVLSIISFSATFEKTKLIFSIYKKISFLASASIDYSGSKFAADYAYFSAFFNVSILFGL